MTTYQYIKKSRRLIWAGVGLGYTTAVAVAILNLNSDTGSFITALAFLLVLAIPSTLAVMALNQRPSLLTAATMGALFPGVLLLTSLVGLVYLGMAILWFFAGQTRPRPAAAPRWATWGRPLLAASIALPVLVMFLHLDPRCTVVGSDGTVSTTEWEGAPSGWRMSMGFTYSTADTVTEGSQSCTSDVVLAWEAGLSIATSVAILVLSRRWPTAGDLSRKAEPSRPGLETLSG